MSRNILDSKFMIISNMLLVEAVMDSSMEQEKRYFSFKFLLQYGFYKKFLWYKWASDQLNTFSSLFDWSHSKPVKKWGKKCSTGQRFICAEVTSYKIHILEQILQIFYCNINISKCPFRKNELKEIHQKKAGK